MSWLDGPILFLDFDGVLNSAAYARREGKGGILGLDPETMPHLQRIVDETDCSIVVSSSWRIGTMLSELRGNLIAAGMRHPCPVRDATPVLDSVSKGGVMISRIRGDEVQAWIDASGYEGRYVCLDDDSDFHPHQPLVKTQWETGLTAEHADRCIALLRGSAPTVKAEAP